MTQKPTFCFLGSATQIFSFRLYAGESHGLPLARSYLEVVRFLSCQMRLGIDRTVTKQSLSLSHFSLHLPLLLPLPSLCLSSIT